VQARVPSGLLWIETFCHNLKVGDTKNLNHSGHGLQGKGLASAENTLQERIMTKRGKILRDASAGPGLVWVNQQQYPFSIGAVWKSEVPPTAGMTVDVEFAPDGGFAGITQVTESQIAKEQAEAAMTATREKSRAALSSAVAKFGLPLLVATGLLIVGWFFLNAISVEALFGKVSFTFWQVLGFLNAGNAWEVVMQGRGSPGAGLYGFLAILALAGPFARFFWKDARANLGGLLPLLFMLLVGALARGSIHSAIGAAVDGPLADMQRQAQDELMNAIKLGLGTYLSMLVSLYLAAASAKQFLVAKAANSDVLSKPNRAIA